MASSPPNIENRNSWDLHNGYGNEMYYCNRDQT